MTHDIKALIEAARQHIAQTPSPGWDFSHHLIARMAEALEDMEKANQPKQGD